MCAALRHCKQNVVSTKIIEKLAAHKNPFCAHKNPTCAHKNPTCAHKNPTSLGNFSKTSTVDRVTNCSMRAKVGLFKWKMVGEKKMVLKGTC